MSTYVFKAIDLTGGKARGEVEADSKQAVSDQLKQRGLIVLDIADKHSSRQIEFAFAKRVKASELAIFSRQLSTMISAGMSILRSLYVLEEQTESKFLKETIVGVRKDVEAGLALSDAMARHPKVFNPLFVAMTQAGEMGGVLEDALMRVADQQQKDAALRRQIKSAMVYPTMVIIFAVGVMMALVAFLVPVFEGVFKQFGGKLPALTQVSVLLSKAVTGYWWLIFGGTAVVLITFIKWKKSSWGRPHWDRFRLRVPMKIGSIVQQVAVARWSRTLASLTGAGVPLLQSLDITGRTGGNVVVEEAMEG
ncbi:MAG: type secretion system family protein, partial [Solirubrobacterales bacterium]|nr:type secretion system family protein [Solirubrobacterales bacterium]